MSHAHAAPLILFLAAATGLMQQPVQFGATGGIVGRWEHAASSVAGVGRILEFTPSGDLYHTAGSLVVGRYSVDGDRLIQFTSSPPETVTVQMMISADTMIQSAADQSESVRLIRRSPLSGTGGIVGTWSSRGPSGSESIVHYRANGNFKLWVPLETDTASYQISGDTVIVEGGNLSGRYRWTTVMSQLRLHPIASAARAAIVLIRVQAHSDFR